MNAFTVIRDADTGKISITLSNPLLAATAHFTWYCEATSNYETNPRTEYSFGINTNTWWIEASVGSGGVGEIVVDPVTTPTWTATSTIKEYTKMNTSQDYTLPSINEDEVTLDVAYTYTFFASKDGVPEYDLTDYNT